MLGALLALVAPLLTACAPPLASPGRGIHVVAADGSGLVRVADGTPRVAWSRDNERLALVDADGVISVVAADGSGASPVPADGSFVGRGWSPDGRRVAAVDAAAGVVRVRAIDGATLAEAPVLDPLPPAWMVASPVDNVPAWSPDGRRLAFLAWDGNGDELYAIAADGSERDKLTHVPASRNQVDRYAYLGQRVAQADVGAPAWSPDGDAIAFALYPEVRGATGGVYVVDADGVWRTRLSGLVPVGGPAWSPDGRRLAFASRQGDQTDLYVVRANGSGLTNLTRFYPGRVRDPAWSPDGRWIAFSGDGDIHVVHPWGTGRVRLAGTELIDVAPQWSPDGGKIAFQSVPPQPGG